MARKRPPPPAPVPDQERAFWRAIIDSPEDDAPRLVYADWLDDHGQIERAELIRASCRLAAMPEHDADRLDLLDRVRELARAETERWQRALKGIVDRLNLHRGLPGWAMLSCPKFLQHGEELFRRAPVVQVSLRPHRPVTKLAASPLLGRVRGLMLGYTIPTLSLSEGEKLLASPHLAGLVHLDLSGNRHGDGLAAALAGARHLTRLSSLDLSSTDLGPDGARALAGAAHLASLRELDLGSNRLGEAGLQALAASPHLGGLRKLKVTYARLG